MLVICLFCGFSENAIRFILGWILQELLTHKNGTLSCSKACLRSNNIFTIQFKSYLMLSLNTLVPIDPKNQIWLLCHAFLLHCMSSNLKNIQIGKSNSPFSKSQEGMSTVSQLAEIFTMSKDNKELSLVKNSALALNCFYLFYSIKYAYIFNFGLQSITSFYIY